MDYTADCETLSSHTNVNYVWVETTLKHSVFSAGPVGPNGEEGGGLDQFRVILSNGLEFKDSSGNTYRDWPEIETNVDILADLYLVIPSKRALDHIHADTFETDLNMEADSRRRCLEFDTKEWPSKSLQRAYQITKSDGKLKLADSSVFQATFIVIMDSALLGTIKTVLELSPVALDMIEDPTSCGAITHIAYMLVFKSFESDTKAKLINTWTDKGPSGWVRKHDKGEPDKSWKHSIQGNIGFKETDKWSPEDWDRMVSDVRHDYNILFNKNDSELKELELTKGDFSKDVSFLADYSKRKAWVDSQPSVDPLSPKSPNVFKTHSGKGDCCVAS